MPLPKRFRCPECGNELPVIRYDCVDSDCAEDIAMQIMSGDLFFVECPYCKQEIELRYDMLYRDVHRGALIWVVHQDSHNYSNKIAEIREGKQPTYKMLRITNSMNGLKEKVTCLEKDRDDKIIELCKVFYVRKLLSSRPNLTISSVVYDALYGDEIYIYDVDGNMFYGGFSDDVYDYLKNTYYQSILSKQFNDNYPIIDYGWAEKTLSCLMECKEQNDRSQTNRMDNSNAMMNDYKVCLKCQASVPSDSDFCPECGEKISKDITLIKDQKEELLAEIEIRAVKGACPILIDRAKLYCTEDRQKYYLRCRFKSLSRKIISALMVDIDCFDVWGNRLSTINNAQILDLAPHQGEFFGNSQKISIDEENTRSVSVHLKKIKYEDGTIEDCIGEEITIPEPISIKDYFSSTALVHQYLREVEGIAFYVPSLIGEFWQCKCGEINASVEQNCMFCNANRQEIFKYLDEDILEKKHQEIAEATKKRKEQERLLQEERQLAEKKKQEELQKERALAEKKRKETARAEEKAKAIRNGIIKVILCIVGIVLFFVMVTAIAKDKAYREQERNMATDVLEKGFSNVYADVVSMEPEYFVYRYETTKYGTKMGEGSLWEVICKCKTVEGKTIWVSFFYQYYPDGKYSDSEADYKSFKYGEDNPLRLVGTIETSDQVMDELEDAIGNVFVLDVREKPQQQIIVNKE